MAEPIYEAVSPETDKASTYKREELEASVIKKAIIQQEQQQPLKDNESHAGSLQDNMSVSTLEKAPMFLSWRRTFRVVFKYDRLSMSFAAPANPDTGNGYYSLMVNVLVKSPDGSPGQAELYNNALKPHQRHLTIEHGIRVSHINEQSLEGVTFQDAISILKNAGRPLKLRFIKVDDGFMSPDEMIQAQLARKIMKAKAAQLERHSDERMSRNTSTDSLYSQATIGLSESESVASQLRMDNNLTVDVSRSVESPLNKRRSNRRSANGAGGPLAGSASAGTTPLGSGTRRRTRERMTVSRSSADLGDPTRKGSQTSVSSQLSKKEEREMTRPETPLQNGRGEMEVLGYAPPTPQMASHLQQSYVVLSAAPTPTVTTALSSSLDTGVSLIPTSNANGGASSSQTYYVPLASLPMISPYRPQDGVVISTSAPQPPPMDVVFTTYGTLPPPGPMMSLAPQQMMADINQRYYAQPVAPMPPYISAPPPAFAQFSTPAPTTSGALRAPPSEAQEQPRSEQRVQEHQPQQPQQTKEPAHDRLVQEQTLQEQKAQKDSTGGQGSTRELKVDSPAVAPHISSSLMEIPSPVSKSSSSNSFEQRSQTFGAKKRSQKRRSRGSGGTGRSGKGDEDKGDEEESGGAQGEKEKGKSAVVSSLEKPVLRRKSSSFDRLKKAVNPVAALGIGISIGITLTILMLTMRMR